MFSRCWVSCLLCTVFVYTAIKWQGAYGKCNCLFTLEGDIYNITSLESKDDTARFTVEHEGYMYSYNPCRSFHFVKAPPIGDCQDDMAMCWWVKDQMYRKIAQQSEAKCDFNERYKMPMIQYTGDGYIQKTTVLLKCNRAKEQAKFKVVDTSTSEEFVFKLTHKCACPNACVICPSGHTKSPTTSPVTTPKHSSKDSTSTAAATEEDPTTSPVPTGKHSSKDPTPTATERKNNSCYHYDGLSGKIYNLAPLKTTVLNVTSKSGYWFSYNPCSPFKIGPAAGECQSEDVAICRWADDGGKVIGSQSSVTWRVDDEIKHKHLMYKTPGCFRNCTAKVMLNCDESKKEEADFVLLHENESEWKFQLTHLCACGNGCRPNPNTDPMDVVIPVVSSAGTAVLLLVIFVIRGIVKERNNAGNNEERRHLLENGVGGRHVDEVHNPIQESLEELSRPAPIGSSHGKR